MTSPRRQRGRAKAPIRRSWPRPTARSASTRTRTYPLSVIGLGLLATVGTLLLLRRGTSYDAIGSEA